MTYPSDSKLVDAFLRAVPPETQLQTARRIGVSDSQVCRWIGARRSGEDVNLQAETRRRMERVVAELSRRDPVATARREAYEDAIAQVQATLDGLRKMLRR